MLNGSDTKLREEKRRTNNLMEIQQLETKRDRLFSPILLFFCNVMIGMKGGGI